MCLQQQTYVSNVLIIGSGVAGLRAAIAAKACGCDVVVIDKRSASEAPAGGATVGFNAALATTGSADSWQQHAADTLRVGHYLGQPEAVQLLAQEAPAAVIELTEWGCHFARTAAGKLDQRLLDEHTRRRTCYAGEDTGRAIFKTLLQKSKAQRIPLHDYQFVTRLLVYEDVCYGALAFHRRTGQRTLYLADAVILATGGHTGLWCNGGGRRAENWGDGMALALAAGCQLIDMEFVQFQPTGSADYSLGGVKVEAATRSTNIVGLYAAGEVAGGVHGARCLAGNALSEAVVFGKRAGEAAAAYSALLIAQLRIKAPIVEAHDELNRLLYTGTKLVGSYQQRLCDTMWACCKQVRQESELQAGLQQLADLGATLEQRAAHPPVKGHQLLAQVLHLRFGLWCAAATLRSALARQESRGVQQRHDFPALNPALHGNFVVTQNQEGQQQIRYQPLGEQST